MVRIVSTGWLSVGLLLSVGCDPRASSASARTVGAVEHEPAPLRASQESKASTDGATVPVVVELFSSEGCSSCPSADEVLRDLDERQPISGVEIIPLEMHVDYWNDLGWADPFSRADLTIRQHAYADARGANGVFTPEAIVDGEGSVVGSQRDALGDRIRAAAARPHVAVGVTVEGTSLRVSIPGAPLASVDAWIAYAESGLSTEVTRGENKGRTLRHAPVVRSLVRVGPASTASLSIPIVDLPGRRDRLRAIVLLQSEEGGAVVGAAMVKL